MLFKILHRFTGAVLFERDADSLRLCVDAAVEMRASLVGASLDGARLDGASLDRASLDGASLVGASGVIDLGQRTDGYRFLLVRHETGPMVKAGCQWLSIAAARERWSDPDYHRGLQLGRESVARIEIGLSTARELGWPMGGLAAKAA